MLQVIRNIIQAYRRKTLSKAALYTITALLTVRSVIYGSIYRIKTFKCLYFFSSKPNLRKQKYLYASPVGKNGKIFLKKVLERFNSKDFDFLIFVYDDTAFKEEIFNKCKFIYESGFKWQFAKRYLTPEVCSKYDYIFFWDDDIGIEQFSYKDFIAVMEENRLDMAQPALSRQSYYFHEITLKNTRYSIGRFTDFVEIMVPVFSNAAWIKFWERLLKEDNGWGLGYDLVIKRLLDFNVGIIDSQPVTHTLPVSEKKPDYVKKLNEIIRMYASKRCRMISYGALR